MNYNLSILNIVALAFSSGQWRLAAVHWGPRLLNFDVVSPNFDHTMIYCSFVTIIITSVEIVMKEPVPPHDFLYLKCELLINMWAGKIS